MNCIERKITFVFNSKYKNRIFRGTKVHRNSTGNFRNGSEKITKLFSLFDTSMPNTPWPVKGRSVVVPIGKNPTCQSPTFSQRSFEQRRSAFPPPDVTPAYEPPIAGRVVLMGVLAVNTLTRIVVGSSGRERERGKNVRSVVQSSVHGGDKRDGR